MLYLLTGTSCAYKQRQILFQSAAQTDSVQASAPREYRIQNQDVLQIRNLQNIGYIVSDVSTGENKTSSTHSETNYQVESDGTVALPVIGRIEVAGKTRLEASRLIEERYKKDVLKDPIIDIRIVNMKVTILGEVKAQGNYPLVKDNTTLTDVLGEAGGLTENANEQGVKIIRGDRKNPQVFYANLGDLHTLSDPRLTLQNNDIIYVMQNKRALRKDAMQNVSAWLQPALVLLNTALVVYSIAR